MIRLSCLVSRPHTEAGCPVGPGRYLPRLVCKALESGLQYCNFNESVNRRGEQSGRCLLFDYLRWFGDVTWTMEYNYDNMLTWIDKDGATTFFTYDGNGERVRKDCPSHDVLYFGEAFETRDGVKTIHLFAGTKRVVSIEYGRQTKFYHTDHLGSTRVVTDSTGEDVQKLEYYPFGSYRVEDPSPSVVPYTFTSQEYDDELGFYNYKARVYDPVIGRFIMPDRIVPRPEDPQSLNRYSYTMNNPMRYNDPSGKASIDAHFEAAFWAGMVYGLGFWGSLKYALDVALVDVKVKDPNVHALTKGKDPQDAKKGDRLLLSLL